MSANKVLRALSALSPGATKNDPLDASDLVWLGTSPNSWGTTGDPLSPTAAPIVDTGRRNLEVINVDGSTNPKGHDILTELRARTRLSGRTTLPVSWITAVGCSAEKTPSFTPLLQTRGEVHPASTSLFDGRSVSRLDRVSDWDFAVPIDDPKLQASLLDSVQFGGTLGLPIASDGLIASAPKLRAWIDALAATQNWKILRVTGAHPGSVFSARGSRGPQTPGEVVICVGFALVLAENRVATGQQASLSAWSEREHIDATAFGTLVGSDPRPPTNSSKSSTAELTCHVPINRAQRQIALSARDRFVTVVSGAPGTGKTHTIAAVCADAVARGESVLIGTRTLEAAAVIGELLHRQPGPEPLRFGSPDQLEAAFSEIERRSALHDRAGGPDRALQAERDFTALSNKITDILSDLADIDIVGNRGTHIEALRATVPGCFDPAADLESMGELLTRARQPRGLFGTSLLSRSRQRSARHKLGSAAGYTCDTDADLERIDDALHVARGGRRLLDAPDIARQLRDLWPAWEAAEKEHRYWTGQELDRLTIDRLNDQAAREALATISSALRSGPTARQRLLSAIEPKAFRNAAPIWLGTLGEIERLLPHVAGFFDLVVIDEASQVDLPLAAPALLRAKRCVVLGDPRQLRHVSFVADNDIEDSFEASGASDKAGLLDVRRNSVFDVAAGVAPVQWLDEHHRSLPHLVEFSLREFYDRDVTLATRFPTSECRDCIDVHTPPKPAEAVAKVISHLRDLARRGVNDVGVITPLRAVAEELRESALLHLGGELIESLNLMITTVHGFQGAERQHVIVVPGIDADSPIGRRRFVENAHLFNVMVSRARKHMDVVTTVEPDMTTLLGRFLQWSLEPPPPTPSSEPTHSSAISLGRSLSDAGLDVRYRYPVGIHHVDIVVQSGERVLGIMCGVHPDGPQAHIERHGALRLAGWRLVDLVPVLSEDAMATLAIELAGDLRS